MKKPDDKNVKGLTRKLWSGNPEDVWGGRVNQNDVPAMERPCYANGCPELGTITESIQVSHTAHWFCRYHSGQKATDWGEITRKLKLAVPVRKHEQPVSAKVGREAIDEVRHLLNPTGDLVAGTFRRIGGGGADVDHKEWAKILRMKEEAGDHLSIMQRQAWREALGVKDQT